MNEVTELELTVSDNIDLLIASSNLTALEVRAIVSVICEAERELTLLEAN